MNGLHMPCPCGQSSDAFAVYEDGHGFCFKGSCNKRFNKEELNEMAYEEKHNSDDILYNSTSRGVTESKHIKLPIGRLVALKDRALMLETCKVYGVTVNTLSGDVALPYHNLEGVKHAVKFRTKDKRFPVTPTGVIQKSMLFGQHIFGGNSRTVTITEGEFDAMSAYQMLGSKYASVSVQSSGAALRDCKLNYEWLNSFSKIVISFDSDRPGQEAAEKVAKLFPGKAYIQKMRRHKDANDYLKGGNAKQWMSEWWDAALVPVEGILMGQALLDISNKPIVKGISVCWPLWNKAVYGIRLKEIWAFGAGSGVGKSEIFKQLAHHLITVHNQKCGMIMLEEDPGKTTNCIFGKDVSERLNLEQDIKYLRGKKLEAPNFDKIMENLVLVNHKTMANIDVDAIISKIEYLVNAVGCKYIFLDHITAIVEGQEDGNVNSLLHAAMSKLGRSVQRHNYTLFMISHLNKPKGKPHEEGGRVTLGNFYGSSAIKQWSNFVFALEGDTQAEGVAKNQRIFRCLKDRERGAATGVKIPLVYDQETGQFNEFDFDMDAYAKEAEDDVDQQYE